ncbi:hypothetical protein SDC9_77379 [bioreactor metagenome]|uniref:Uncharacterized protein n=1 Tax=bioreactor metagenome TaxID=1076179 RepID=A0A644YR98_9ZZZZ
MLFLITQVVDGGIDNNPFHPVEQRVFSKIAETPDIFKDFYKSILQHIFGLHLISGITHTHAEQPAPIQLVERFLCRAFSVQTPVYDFLYAQNGILLYVRTHDIGQGCPGNKKKA